MFLLALSIFIIGACSAQKLADSTAKGQAVSQQDGEFKEFKMTAKQFAFEPSTIEVNKGDRVRLIVTSTDVPHGIAIPEYAINEKLDPGKPKTIEFTAVKSGTFKTFCSVFCGPEHGAMKGSIVVK